MSHPYHCGDATFVLMLHINDDAFDDIEHTSQVFVTEIYTYIYTRIVCALIRRPNGPYGYVQIGSVKIRTNTAFDGMEHP